MEHCKLQICCLVILLYVAVIYIRDCRRYGRKLKDSLFDELMELGFACILFDCAASYTINNISSVPELLNKALNLMFLICLDSVIFLLFLYMLLSTGVSLAKKSLKAAVIAPYVINIIVLICTINSIEYLEGTISNYSFGFPVFVCFAMAAIYVLMTIITFFLRKNYINSNKRTNIITYLIAIIAVIIIQLIWHDALLSSLAVTIFIIGMYMNLEDPALKELSRYHDEMVAGFSNLIENRDDSTGGHVKRTGLYANAIAAELYRTNVYKNELTQDFMENLSKSASTHDIGKVAVPDAILCKSGRLTEEEYEKMKLHTVKGGQIIKQTFGQLCDEQYLSMAYSVAMYHHEKWNGRGYPTGISGENIPLCARIISIADVFDAISEKRCYRDAMPIDECFEIIADGRGRDFDPVIVDSFLNIKDKIIKIHTELAESALNDEENEKEEFKDCGNLQLLP